MKKLIGSDIGGYVFSASAKTITLKNLPSIKLEQVLVITNTTKNKILYSFSDSIYPITIANNIITLSYDTSTMSDTDTIQIFLDLSEEKGSFQKRFRDGFAGSAVNENKWDYNKANGMAIAVGANTMAIQAGTTANETTYLLSKETFRFPCRLQVSMLLSSRIANNSFYIEFVSVDEITGAPDGVSSCGFLFDGTSATAAKVFGQENSIAATTFAATTITTASAAVFEIDAALDECTFNSYGVNASGAMSSGQVINDPLFDPNALYKIRLRVVNGSTAPASSVTWTINYISCMQYSEILAEISGGRGNAVAGNAIPTFAVGGTSTVTGTVTANQGTPANPTTTTVLATASTNANFAKASAGTVYGVSIMNYSASARYLKLYNKASAPTVGTDSPVTTIVVPATSAVHIPFGTYGRRFSTGIAYALTGGFAETDATVVAAGDCKFNIDYI